MIQQSKIFPKQRHHNHLAKIKNSGFLTVEALVASLITSILLIGTVKIIEQQNHAYSRTISLQKIHNAIYLDVKAIRHYATMWKSENLDYQNTNTFPDATNYNSSIACRAFNTRNMLEVFYRSDAVVYNRIFPFAPAIHQNNIIIARISDNLGNTYRVKRTYINSSNVTNSETDSYTLRVKYTTDVVNSENVATPLSLEHTMDVNLVAQYSC